MPSGDRQCHVCREYVKGHNMKRHVMRWHPDWCHSSENNQTSTQSGSILKETAASDAESEQQRNVALLPRHSPEVPVEYVRNAVLCMLRRPDGNNLPTLVSYLQKHFPAIPGEWQIPLVIATFAYAQKVAATHVDAVLGDSDERVDWAKRSLARWGHGLSAVEPLSFLSGTSDRESSESRDSSLSISTATDPKSVELARSSGAS